MKPISASVEIKEEDVENFAKSLMQDTAPNTLAVIANNFRWRVSSLEETVKEMAKKGPDPSRASDRDNG